MKQPIYREDSIIDVFYKHRSTVLATMTMLLFAAFLIGRSKINTVVETTKVVETQDANWQAMVAALTEVSDKYNGDVGIYLKDLKSGRTFERHADRKYVAASLIKIPIMAAVFQAIHENKISLSSTMKLRRDLIRSGSGDMRWAKVGRRFQVSQIMYKMITKSDNTATAMFIDRFGYDYINKCFADFGLNTLRLDPVGMTLAAHVNPERDNYTTPREMGLLLEKMYEHKLVADGSSDLMLEIMKRAEGPTRLAKFLPKNWVLARKGGLLRKNLHDVGVVFAPKTDFVICVMTQENQTYKKAKGLIATIGQTTYTYMDRS